LALVSALQLRSRAWYGSLGLIPEPIWKMSCINLLVFNFKIQQNYITDHVCHINYNFDKNSTIFKNLRTIFLHSISADWRLNWLINTWPNLFVSNITEKWGIWARQLKVNSVVSQQILNGEKWYEDSWRLLNFWRADTRANMGDAM
jgi:hypothetical protein